MVVVLLGRVIAYDERVLWQILEEAFGRGAINVKVQSRGEGEEGEERQESPHLDVGFGGAEELSGRRGLSEAVVGVPLSLEFRSSMGVCDGKLGA